MNICATVSGVVEACECVCVPPLMTSRRTTSSRTAERFFAEGAIACLFQLKKIERGDLFLEKSGINHIHVQEPRALNKKRRTYHYPTGGSNGLAKNIKLGES